MTYGWATKKTETDFEWKVTKSAYQVPTETVKAGRAPTRAIAMRKAKEWCRYHRRMAARA